MKNVKAQATLKIREAMSGLREAMKTASPSDRRAIHACMSELRAIKADLDEAPAVIEEVAVAAPDAMDVVSEANDSLDGDEELALSALELAASALKAAAEEEAAADEGAAEEKEDSANEDEGNEEAESEAAEAEEDEATEDEAEAGEAADAEGSDVDALTDEEINALEAEGLLEGAAVFKRPVRKPIVRKPAAKVAAKATAKTPVRANSVETRLARVQSRLNVLLAEGEDVEVVEDLSSYMEDEEIEEEEFGEDDEIAEDESEFDLEGEPGEDLDEDFADFEGASEDQLLDEDEAELTPEEIAMLEEMGIGLEASTLILASSNVLWAAKKRKKATKGAKAASAKKWKGAKVIGRSMVKKTKKGKFYVTVYRKKGNLSGNFNMFYAKKPAFKKLKVPKGASKAVAQRIAKHNKIAGAKVMKMSPSQAKKK